MTPTPPPPPSALSHWPVEGVPKLLPSHSKGCKQRSRADTYYTSIHTHPSIHPYLVVAQHLEELLVALLRDEDALSGGDAAAAGQTVIQCDLCFLQLLLPTILQTQGEFIHGGMLRFYFAHRFGFSLKYPPG